MILCFKTHEYLPLTKRSNSLIVDYVKNDQYAHVSEVIMGFEYFHPEFVQQHVPILPLLF